MSRIRIEQVEKIFGAFSALDKVSFTVEEGEFVVFVGPSGCGKTTLLRTIAGLEKPTDGRIFIGEDDVTFWAPARRGVSMVFQSYALYPHMSVRENIGFGLKAAKIPPGIIAERVRETAALLQIEQFLDRKPKALSGGQRQRVAIGRAIVRQPRAFLFDEPLSNLDAELRVQMRAELVALHERLKSTMIYVTHDQVEAMTMADRIVVLHGGQVEQIGAPLELYRAPRNAFVAGFIGSPKMNFIPVTVSATGAQGVTVDLPGLGPLTVPVEAGSLKPGAGTRLGIRPEHLLFGPAPDTVQLAAEAMLVEHLGGEVLLHVGFGGNHTLILRKPGDVPVERGGAVTVSIPPELCYLFDTDTTSLAPLHPAASRSSRTRSEPASDETDLTKCFGACPARSAPYLAATSYAQKLVTV